MTDPIDAVLLAPWWPAFVAHKDSLPLAALAKRFAVKEGLLRKALARMEGGAGAGLAAVLEQPPTEPRRTPARRGRRSKIDRYAHLLGTVPDRDVADRAGVSRAAVGQYRAARNIPPFVQDALAVAPARPAPTAPGTYRRPPSPIHPYADRLGTVPDSHIARLAGVGVDSVKEYRQRHGIPGFRRQRAEPLPPAPPVAAPRGAAAEVWAPPAEAGPPSVWTITAVREAGVVTFTVLGADLISTALRAARALGKRTDGPWQIDAIGRVAEALV